LAVADPPRAAAATEEPEYPFGSSVALFHGTYRVAVPASSRRVWRWWPR